MLDVTWELLDLKTREPFHIARASDPTGRRNVWVRVRDEDGVEGWGEAPATPFYGETAETVMAVLPRYAEALNAAVDAATEQAAAMGLDAGAGSPGAFALERVEAALETAVGRNPAARVALSSALHDLVGKRLDVPAWRLWGLDPVDAPTSSFTLSIDTPDRMREKAAAAASYPILKIKVGTDHDEANLAAIRDVRPDAVLKVDANTAWTAKQAIANLPMLEAYGVELLEQPLKPDDLTGFRALRARSAIPVVADESCRTLADIQHLVGAVDGINIKLAKCGSLREAQRMVHAARAHGMEVMLGCMLQSTLGMAALMQLAPLMDHLDLDGALLLKDDPFVGPRMAEDGSIRLNTTAGLGVSRREGGT